MDRFTQVSEENFRIKDENHRLKIDLRTKQILDDLISPYASKAYGYMCAYSSVVVVLLLLSGCQASGFKLDAAVLALLVGSTAVTVIGLVGMVLTGIFVGARRATKE